MKTILTFYTFLIALTSFSQEGAIWTSTTTGTIDGITFTLTGITGESLDNYDLTTADFSAAPLTANQEGLSYDGYSSVTITFASPINLYVYAKYWRTDTYVFSNDVSLLSGANLTQIDNTTIDAVSYADGVIMVNAPVTTFTITSTIQSCCSNQAILFVGTQVSGAGINDISSFDLSIYPNPATSSISIATNDDIEIQDIKLSDLQGREINITTNDYSTIDVSQIPSGNYFVEVKTNKGILRKKVMVN